MRIFNILILCGNLCIHCYKEHENISKMFINQRQSNRKLNKIAEFPPLIKLRKSDFKDNIIAVKKIENENDMLNNKNKIRYESSNSGRTKNKLHYFQRDKKNQEISNINKSLKINSLKNENTNIITKKKYIPYKLNESSNKIFLNSPKIQTVNDWKEKKQTEKDSKQEKSELTFTFYDKIYNFFSNLIHKRTIYNSSEITENMSRLLNHSIYKDKTSDIQHQFKSGIEQDKNIYSKSIKNKIGIVSKTIDNINSSINSLENKKRDIINNNLKIAEESIQLLVNQDENDFFLNSLDNIFNSDFSSADFSTEIFSLSTSQITHSSTQTAISVCDICPILFDLQSPPIARQTFDIIASTKGLAKILQYTVEFQPRCKDKDSFNTSEIQILSQALIEKIYAYSTKFPMLFNLYEVLLFRIGLNNNRFKLLFLLYVQYEPLMDTLYRQLQVITFIPILTPVCAVTYNITSWFEDINECLLQMDNCPQELRCVNIIGSYLCICKLGTSYNFVTFKCEFPTTQNLKEIEYQSAQCSSNQRVIDVEGHEACVYLQEENGFKIATICLTSIAGLLVIYLMIRIFWTYKKTSN